jgi:hypothetical protein
MVEATCGAIPVKPLGLELQSRGQGLILQVAVDFIHGATFTAVEIPKTFANEARVICQTAI